MQADVFQQQGIITIQGAITFETVATILKKTTCLWQKTPGLSEYYINLTGVTQVNSAALGLLIELKKKTILKNKSVVFTDIPERLLSLAKLYSVSVWLGLETI